MKFFRRLFYKCYLIAFIDKKDNIGYRKIYASTQRNAVIRWRRNCKYDYKIIAISKINKNLGELL